MKKLLDLWCLLCFVATLAAQEASNLPKTYTVSIKKLTTSFDNVLIEPIPKFTLEKLWIGLFIISRIMIRLHTP